MNIILYELLQVGGSERKHRLEDFLRAALGFTFRLGPIKVVFTYFIISSMLHKSLPMPILKIDNLKNRRNTLIGCRRFKNE